MTTLMTPGFAISALFARPAVICQGEASARKPRDKEVKFGGIQHGGFR